MKPTPLESTRGQSCVIRRSRFGGRATLGPGHLRKSQKKQMYAIVAIEARPEAIPDRLTTMTWSFFSASYPRANGKCFLTKRDETSSIDRRNFCVSSQAVL